ncbi:hypothetical protein [Spirosoma areae]
MARTPPKRRINIELLLGISATFLSLAALVVSIFQTRIAREQQQASVWPYLQILVSQFDDECHIGVENKGVGPAVVKYSEWRFKGKTYKTAQDLYLDNFGGTEGGKGFSSIEGGDVLKSGENLDLISVRNNNAAARALYGLTHDTTFRFRAVYSDVYGNCWQLDRDKTTPLGNCNNH